jgi:hypothetical protein
MDKKGWITGFRADAWKGVKPEFDLVDAKVQESDRRSRQEDHGPQGPPYR